MDAASAHTPGPWKWRHVYNASGNLHAMLLETTAPNQPCNDPCIMAAREDWLDYLDRNQKGNANALLIAAAPGMFATLQALRTWLVSPMTDSETLREMFELADASLSVATPPTVPLAKENQ